MVTTRGPLLLGDEEMPSMTPLHFTHHFVKGIVLIAFLRMVVIVNQTLTQLREWNGAARGKYFYFFRSLENSSTATKIAQLPITFN